MKYFIIAIILLANIIANGQVSLSLPIERSVFQRNNSGQASVTFGGQATVSTNTYKIQYKLVSLNKNGGETNALTQPWVNITTFGGGRTFQFNLSISTGWYRMYIRASQNGVQVGGTASAKFGVGEVIVMAGQSNSQGCDNNPTPPSLNITGDNSEISYDCVNSSSQDWWCKKSIPPLPIIGKMENYSRVAPNGCNVWAYQRLGKQISNSESPIVVPVLFFNAAASGTSVIDWIKSAKNPSYVTKRAIAGGQQLCGTDIAGAEDGGKGQPYASFKNCLNYYSSIFGVRGVVWHQGESDTFISTTSTTYTEKLDSVILMSRNHFNSGLAWAISNVSYIKGQISPLVITGQSGSRTNNNAAVAANNSDGIASTKRVPLPDGTHFIQAGLQDLSDQYFSNFSSLKAKTPVLSTSPPSITVTPNSTGGATLTVPTGYSEYRWVQYDGNYKNVNCSNLPNPCSNSITVASNSGNWRCYIKNSLGNIILTRKVYLPVTLSNARISNNKSFFDEEEGVIKSSVYPNPTFRNFQTTIAFELPADANNVRLDIVDDNGNIIKTIANGTHASGKYQYPFDIKDLPKSINLFYYRLTVDDLVETKRLLILK